MTPLSAETPRGSRWLPILITTAFFLFLAYLLRFVLLPFLIAGGLAFVAMPAVRWIEAKFRVPRWVAAMGPFFAMLVVLAGLGWVIERYAIPDITNLIVHRQEVIEQFLTVLFRGKSIPTGQGQAYTPHDAAIAILNGLGNVTPRGGAVEVISVAFAFLMSLLLTVVLLAYFLIDGPRIARGFLWVVPPAHRQRVSTIAKKSGPMIFRYVRGMIVITIYATVLTWGVMQFVLHLPHPIILALAVGLLELVPMLGPILSIVLICLVAIQQLTFWSIIGMAIFVTVLRVTIDQFVGPIVLGKAVSLPPPVVIFAFIAGGEIYGLMGIVIAIPAAAVVKIILEQAYGEEIPVHHGGTETRRDA